jgi:hypothetical protein
MAQWPPQASGEMGPADGYGVMVLPLCTWSYYRKLWSALEKGSLHWLS